ncbi:MAG TPA: hypothetical protein VGY50_16200 [Streptosporangiaceae bacterium]|nr:hypothetical protein [Streptosporangiaceae bacterium]
MNAEQVAALRMLLAPTGWLDRAAEFARALRGSARTPGGLLLVGTPEHEPWHFAAHLDDESRFAGLPELAPTLVRWRPPPGAPAHLSVGLARLGDAGRGDSLVVVSPQAAPDRLLERVSDARRGGATILALDRGDGRLAEVAHEALTVAPSAPLSFDAAQHLVSAAAAERGEPRHGLRARLARLLDTVSGPPG